MAKDCSFCIYYQFAPGADRAIDDRECTVWGECPYGNDVVEEEAESDC